MLDQLAICSDRGQLMAMFGLGSEIYVPPRDAASQRLLMLDIQQNYYGMFKNELDKCRIVSEKDPDGRITTISCDPFPAIREAIGEWPKARGYSNVLYKRFVHPKFPKDADTVSPYVSGILLSAEADKRHRMGVHSCYMPVSIDGKASLNFELIREALLRWCRILKPAHGSAGYCVILEYARILADPYIYSVLQRHPGLDFLGPVQFSDCVENVYNRIKGANWLTVLGDALLEELGGLTVAKHSLEPLCQIIEYDGGIIVQAGDVPLLGNALEGDIPKPYKVVSEFTRPVRFENYTRPLFRVFEPMIAREEAQKWVRRFD